MKRKLNLLALALLACISLSATVRADGPMCGTTGYPGFICPATAPAPTPSPLEAASDAVIDALLFIL